MQILRTILTILFVIDCIALTVVVLMQEGKSQGLGAIAGAAETYWGKNKGRSMEGMLVKITKILADDNMNIADMTNKSKGAYAYTMIDIDSDVTDSVIEDLTKVKDVLRVRVIR